MVYIDTFSKLLYGYKLLQKLQLVRPENWNSIQSTVAFGEAGSTYLLNPRRRGMT
jgi:hypothetical protein